MSNKILKRIQRRYQDLDESVPEAEPYHSKAYHRHFEGYTEVTEERLGKGTKITRIYTGDYYSQPFGPLSYMLLRLLYIAIVLASTALYIAGALPNLSSNSTVYVVIAEALAGLFLLRIFFVLIFYLTAKRKMTVGDYRSTSLSLIKAARNATIACTACALLTLLHILLNQQEASMQHIQCAVYFLSSAILMLLLNRAEYHIPYTKTPSQEKVPHSGFEIL